jgi:uncharacterized protein involved in exopolysaccharide biosynthesis
MEEKKQAPINITDIIKTLWPHRKLYFKVLPATLILTYLFTLFIPRYYKCTVSLAPEPTGASLSGSLGSLGSLASSMGLGSLGKMAGSRDALNSEIYPDILKSNDFIAELMTVKVQTQEGDVKTNYYTYQRDHQSYPWWVYIKGAIIELFDPTPEDEYNGEEKISVFNLTEQQSAIFKSVSGKIKCTIDKKTDIVDIVVQDQDPLVAATMAQATCEKLQEFIINYRTNKAKIDYEYYKKLTETAKADYEKVRRKYGATSDANMDVTMKSMELLLTDLENDMQLRYNVYTAMNAQMQSAAAKLQEATPAFTVIQSASIPTKPAGPRRLIISVAMMILSFFVLSGKILLKKIV